MADGAGQAAFLGVERSVSGRRWRWRPADADAVRSVQQAHGLSEVLARALVSRGVRPGQAGDYLSPTLRALFPDPSCFRDMDAAAEALIDALIARQSVWVFADYDVDGASSAALLVRWFRSMGLELQVYVPDRLTEGYGPSAQAFARMKEAGADLVVTVDCGAAAHDALEAAAHKGDEVVVIDHQQMRGDPPRARAVVNPNRPDCGSAQGNLAAAGVVFVLLAALNREARRRGLFADRPEPDLRQWLDLAALGAFCDVTSLTGFNRALASLGLKVMSTWSNVGVSALMEAAQSPLTAATPFHAGFILGPRINAGGRVGRSDLGARLLATDDPDEARDLAEQLNALNATRREVEKEVTEACALMIERGSNHSTEGPLILAAGEGWHPGVIGVVAGRLKERWRRPVIVVGIDLATGVGKGSGRSIAGVNLGRAVQAAFDEGLLLAGGGHAMAAGLTVKADLLPELRAFLEARLSQETSTALEEDALEIDVLITARGADRALLESFDRLAPFGPGNVEPVFAVSGVLPRDIRVLNGGHIACRLTDPDGASLKAIAWRAAETPLGETLLGANGSLDLAGVLKADDWNGRRGVQFEIHDAHDPRRIG